MKYKVTAEYNTIGKREYETDDWEFYFYRLEHSKLVMFIEVLDLETNKVIKLHDERELWQWNEERKVFDKKKEITLF